MTFDTAISSSENGIPPTEIPLGTVSAPLSRRERQKLEKFTGPSAGSQVESDRTAWFDTLGLSSPADADGIFLRVIRDLYTGVILHPDTFEAFAPIIPAAVLKVFAVADPEGLTQVMSQQRIKDLASAATSRLVIASDDTLTLKKAQGLGLKTCLRSYVDDSPSLHGAIETGRQHAYLMIRFKDPTNIPLELVIASLQASGTVLIKEINLATDAEDAVVSLGVMEVGADGVMYSPRAHVDLDAFAKGLKAAEATKVPLAMKTATIVKTKAVGMGYRSCLDLATLFAPNEGMLIGSTSYGGILCCPEVFHLPYMELRPFRVNAGGVHSYVYSADNKTNYMTELAAGSEAMIVSLDGKVRTAPVGRVKTEVRPLRLLEAEFEDGTRVNVLLQDDWHVRVFSPAGQPLNITELKPGDQVLAYQAAPGRHVGIKIDENIVEG